jgi:hypothetical protein
MAAAPPRNNEKPCTGGPDRCGRTAGRPGLQSFAFFSGKSSPSKMSVPAYSTRVSQIQGDFSQSRNGARLTRNYLKPNKYRNTNCMGLCAAGQAKPRVG